MSAIVLPSLAFGVSVLAAWLLAHPRIGPRILDRPNERSLHVCPVPRTGGVAILGGMVAAALVARSLTGWPEIMPWIVVIGLLVGGVSFVDDCRPLPARWRFLVHLVAAASFLVGGLGMRPVGPGEEAGWFLLALFGVVWSINLYNFMDGIDGLAAGMAVIGFSGLAILASLHGGHAVALSALVVASAAGGFLVWNFSPARLFMGDSGSSTLGLLAAALSLWAARVGVPIESSIVVFSPFIADASWTLVRRLLRGARIWQPHKEHAYQRLVESGWGHRRTALAAYGLMGICFGVALLVSWSPPPVRATVLVGLGLAWIGLFGWVDRRTVRPGRADRR